MLNAVMASGSGSSTSNGQAKEAPSGLQFRLCPPTLSLMSNDIDDKMEPLGRGKFLKIRATRQMNGCFIGVMVKTVG